jgi:glyoxylase-like metal-dependent hydrolase (beta-lactamase superfamily II)
MEETAMLRTTMGLVVALLCCASAHSQQTQRGQTSSLREIIPGHYMFSSGDLNSGIIATNEGVVVFDALDSEAVARAEREAIANTIRQPVRFLVSSPYHNPFSKGNVAYADVWKIGHEFYRTDLVRQMERDKASPEERKARLPNQTFRDRMTLYLGGKEIQVLYLGRAHTRGDSIVYVPQDRIVYLSEVFSAGQFLFMNDGYGLDWLKTVEAVAGLEADIFVPGHSSLPADPKQSREEFLRYRQMLVDVRDSVAQALARGVTEEQAVATIQWPQYEKLRGYEAQRPSVIRRFYRQLTGGLP